jgi:hypothetical protein
MIYESPEPGQPIRQGDIFKCVPRLTLRLDEFQVLEDFGVRPAKWLEEVERGIPRDARAVVGFRAVNAIVITQDCDAFRSPSLALCEIDRFQEVETSSKDTTKPTAWMGKLTRQARINQKWYYLPPCDDLGFDGKMAVDFRKILLVDRDGLESMTPTCRLARLNHDAYLHFRERLSEFFRRYPYNEWYALDKEELEAYEKEHKVTVVRYPWQT